MTAKPTTIQDAIIAAVDEHLPYRIGGPGKPDVSGAKADAEQHYAAFGDNLALSRVTAVAETLGLSADPWYLKELRRQLILRHMRAGLSGR